MSLRCYSKRQHSKIIILCGTQIIKKRVNENSQVSTSSNDIPRKYRRNSRSTSERRVNGEGRTFCRDKDKDLSIS